MTTNKIQDKTAVYRETDVDIEKGTQRPILESRIGRFSERLRDAIGSESIRGFANQIGVVEGTLRNWLKEGGSYPDAKALANIHLATDVSLDWLILGDDAVNEADNKIDMSLLHAVLSTLDQELKAVNIDMPADKRLKFAAAAYGDAVESSDDPSEQMKLIEYGCKLNAQLLFEKSKESE
ncbi:MAG: hypothetical protein GKR93_12170 [Gammaproteobacteria bacterium]|nr:hypothetical protein [Gammaproteobacteria bacterium]